MAAFAASCGGDSAPARDGSLPDGAGGQIDSSAGVDAVVTPIDARASGGDGGSGAFHVAVGAVGDWYDDDPAMMHYREDAIATRDNILARGPEVLLGLGDYDYTSSRGAAFFDLIRPLEAATTIRPTWGNHDGIDSGAITDRTKYEALRSHFGVDEWYSFDVGRVHFVAINSEYPQSSSRYAEQLDFVQRDLAAADANPSIDWIVPYFHRAMLNALSSNGPDFTLQNVYHPLIDRYRAKIGLALQAHHHIYVRTHAVRYSDARDASACMVAGDPSTCEEIPTIASRGTGSDPVVFDDVDGIVFAMVGTGGAFATGLTPARDYIAVRFHPESIMSSGADASSFGYLHMDIDVTVTSRSLSAAFYGNDGAVRDRFTIRRAR